MGTNDHTTWMAQNFSGKAFLQGMGAIVFLLALMVIWSAYRGPAILEQRQKDLASQTVAISRPHSTEDSQLSSEPFGPPVPAGSTFMAPPPPPPPVEAAVEADPVPPPPAPPVEEATPAPQQQTQQPHTGPLATAPQDGLFERTPEGRLPIVNEKDGMTSFKAYKRPSPAFAFDTPVLSIAVMDMGLSTQVTNAAIKTLPPEISLIFSPYAATPDEWVAKARNDGHEVWLGLPMETADYPKTDPGALTLIAGVPEKENLQKITTILARTTGYVGLVGTPSPEFLNHTNDMRAAMAAIFKRGLAFVDSSERRNTTLETMALGMNAPYTHVDQWIGLPPGDTSPTAIRASLEELESIARDNGFAAAVLPAIPGAFAEIDSWAKTLAEKGMALAPLSAQTGH